MEQSSRQLTPLWIFGPEMIFSTSIDYVSLLNSFNFEAPPHPSSYIRYAWLSECWPWAINETFTTCTVCWGGIAEDESFLNDTFSFSFLLQNLPSNYYHFRSYRISWNVFYLSSLSGYVSYSSSAIFLVPWWLTKDCSFYFTSRILSH